MTNRKSFRSFLAARSGKDILKRIKPKRRRKNDNSFGTRRGEGGLPSGSFYGGIGFGGFMGGAGGGDGGDGGGGGESIEMPNNQMITEKRRGRNRRKSNQDEFTFGSISPKAQFHDQGNSGHMNMDPRPLPNEPKRRRDLENQEEDQEKQPNQDEFSNNDQMDQSNSNDQDQDPNDMSFDDVGEEKDVDPDRMGLVRRVKDAHLVYKRQTESGTYEELWIYNIADNIHDELKIRRAILAGTDIPAEKMATKDHKQSFDLWTSGNAQLLYISGLPN